MCFCFLISHQPDSEKKAQTSKSVKRKTSLGVCEARAFWLARYRSLWYQIYFSGSGVRQEPGRVDSRFQGIWSLISEAGQLPGERRLVRVRRLGLRLLQDVRELLERSPDELRRLPEVRREVRVRLLERREDRLDEVPARLRVPAGAREAIGDAGEGQHLLRRGGTDDAGTSLVYLASMTNDDVK